MKLVSSPILVFIFIIDFSTRVFASPSPDKLLVILLDAFRWDYLNVLEENGGFKTFIKNGVKAQHMVPIYPAESYPNYFALMTGLYGESHGVLFNYMYDPKCNATFNMGEGEESRQSHWFDQAEPIWVTAERNNISTASLEWPSAEIAVRGIVPTVVIPYTLRVLPSSLKWSLRKAVNLLASGQIQYCQVFTEWTDFIAHTMGPDAMKQFMVPTFIDSIITDLLNYIKIKKLDKTLNIVIMSDHGMTKTDIFSAKSIELDLVLNKNDYNLLIDHGSHFGVYPIDGKENEICKKLKRIKGLKVFKKEEIPDEYRIKNHVRVPPIFVEVLRGYYVLPLKDDSKQIGGLPKFQVMGYHGYNPANYSDMWGIFMASGPAFKKGVKFAPIHNVDVYNILTYLLAIPPHPNNGSWHRVQDMLIPYPR